MGQGPSLKAKKFYPHLRTELAALWNTIVHYRVHKSPILSQMNTVHNLPPFPKIKLNVSRHFLCHVLLWY
jgi:hypothetical protein